MELLNRKRIARSALFEIAFDKRVDLENWLDENIVRGGSITTEEILSAMQEEFTIDEEYSKFIEWYLFNKDDIECTPIKNNRLRWNVSVLKKESLDISSVEVDQEMYDKNEYTVFREWPTKDQKAYRNAIAKRKDNTILTSKRRRGDWTGLRLFLTNNGFEESRVGSTSPLKEIMKYYDFEKPNKEISYEFLRDRLLYDGLKEFDLDKPLEQHTFNITQPNLELRQRYRAAMKKKEGVVNEK